MREVQEIFQDILSKRGIVSDEDIAEFLSDKPQRTYNPFLLHNLEEGVDLILSEINSGKKICIYGDYDADGVTSTCILSTILGELTSNFTYYIPDREEEGYGLNMKAIDKVHAMGVDLIVTVDCGSVSYDEVEYIKSLGMNVIVTDHHTIDDVQADCILINPKQKDCTYPFKDLAGCGVAFKLAQGLQQKAGLPKSLLNSVLDLVAVGTVGDIVSLKDENRTIVKYGLNRINANARPALNKLKEAISFKSISAENIAFGIAPHINAAGRMAHASEAAKLFLTSSEAEMDEQVKKLVEYNTRRKKEQDTAFKSCLEYIKGDEDIIILRLDYIHEGIAGIVAGKIKEEFNRTAIIVTPSDGVYLKGTGRSIENINIYDLLNGHNELFTRFGGHKAACGFLMPVENYDVFKSSLEADVEAMKEANPDLYGKTTEWDEVLEPGEVTCELAKEMEKLEPCGQGNPKPKFRLENVKGMYPFFMGSDETHVKFKAVSRDGDQAECILFQRAQVYKDRLFGGGEVSLIGSVNYQTWRGVDRVQFVVEEIL